ncbi:MAG: hypothetical protein J5883_08260 [Clostridiales bacterium]|nr:hypothetical protein [Clostridiales bacterium]
MILSCILGFFPWKESMRKLFYGRYKHLRTELLVLLQVLTTSISSGYSLERSLCYVRPVIENTFGKRSPLVKPLIELENNLKVHMDLRSALSVFSGRLDFPQAEPVFHALAISSSVGSSTLAILRSSCQMISEMNAVRNEISAANAGKNAEALMLCIMPFAITAALDRMGNGYLGSARTTSAGAFLLSAAFATGIIASALLFRFMTASDDMVPGTKAVRNFGRPVRSRILSTVIKKIMPPGFLSSRHELFSELYPDVDDSYERYLKKQITVFTGVLTVSLAVLYKTGKPLIFAPFCAILCVAAGIYDVRRSAALKREDLMRDIPLFLCLMCTLLESGLQIPKSIEICSGAFPGNTSLTLEIKNLRAMILSGISPSDAVEKMSLRIQIPEAQSALLLVARYGRLGTKEVLNLLSLQSSACWNLSRNAARKKQEREALGLLFPMTLDFICVLIVATTPAIISLGI